MVRPPRMNLKQEEEYKAAEAELNFAKNELLKVKDGDKVDKDALAKAEDEVRTKEKEILALVESFKSLKGPSSDRPKFERPSERRARQEAEDRGVDADGFMLSQGGKTRGGDGGGYNRREGGGRGGRGGGFGGGRGDRDDRPRTCYNCNQEGHMAKDCSEPRQERSERGKW